MRLFSNKIQRSLCLLALLLLSPAVRAMDGGGGGGGNNCSAVSSFPTLAQSCQNISTLITQVQTEIPNMENSAQTSINQLGGSVAGSADAGSGGFGSGSILATAGGFNNLSELHAAQAYADSLSKQLQEGAAAGRNTLPVRAGDSDSVKQRKQAAAKSYWQTIRSGRAVLTSLYSKISGMIGTNEQISGVISSLNEDLPDIGQMNNDVATPSSGDASSGFRVAGSDPQQTTSDIASPATTSYPADNTASAVQPGGNAPGEQIAPSDSPANTQQAATTPGDANAAALANIAGNGAAAPIATTQENPNSKDSNANPAVLNSPIPAGNFSLANNGSAAATPTFYGGNVAPSNISEDAAIGNQGSPTAVAKETQLSELENSAGPTASLITGLGTPNSNDANLGTGNASSSIADNLNRSLAVALLTPAPGNSSGASRMGDAIPGPEAAPNDKTVAAKEGNSLDTSNAGGEVLNNAASANLAIGLDAVVPADLFKNNSNADDKSLAQAPKEPEKRADEEAALGIPSSNSLIMLSSMDSQPANNYRVPANEAKEAPAGDPKEKSSEEIVSALALSVVPDADAQLDSEQTAAPNQKLAQMTH